MLLTLILDVSLIVLIYMTIWFIFSVYARRNDVADVAWGLGFVFVSLSALFLTNNFSLSGLLTVLLVTIWGIRLFKHIASRNMHHDEDKRYTDMKKTWGKMVLIRSYIQVFLIQGFMLLLVSSVAVISILNGNNNINVALIIGLVIWIVGFIFESLGDWQLKKFLANPKKDTSIMKTGLWKYTRHPNYFGEVTMWWGICVIANSNIFTIYTLIGPITISILILFVSGIPMTEKMFTDRPEWNDYKNKTSIFLPLPPKK